MQVKLILILVALSVGGGFIWHYKHVIAERDQLRADVVVYQRNEQILNQTIEDERTAAKQAITDRADMKRRLDELRRARENDPEAQEWAVTPIPAGELERLCQALPNMEGCDEQIQP